MFLSIARLRRENFRPLGKPRVTPGELRQFRCGRQAARHNKPLNLLLN
jgi:hypothetical protein